MDEKPVKILHVQVIDGDEKDIDAIGKSLKEVREKLESKLDFELEFLVSNDRVEIRDVRTLIKELMALYKKQTQWYEQVRKDTSDKNDET